MANTRNAGGDRGSRKDLSQDNLRTNMNSEQESQEISNLRNQANPAQKGSVPHSANKKSGFQEQSETQKVSKQTGSIQSGSSSKRGSDRDRSSSGLRSSSLDNSTQTTSGQQYNDQTGREEGSDR